MIIINPLKQRTHNNFFWWKKLGVLTFNWVVFLLTQCFGGAFLEVWERMQNLHIFFHKKKKLNYHFIINLLFVQFWGFLSFFFFNEVALGPIYNFWGAKGGLCLGLKPALPTTHPQLANLGTKPSLVAKLSFNSKDEIKTKIIKNIY